MEFSNADLRSFYLIAIKVSCFGGTSRPSLILTQKESVTNSIDDDGTRHEAAEVNAIASVQQQLLEGPSISGELVEDVEDIEDTPTSDDEHETHIRQTEQEGLQPRKFLRTLRATRNLSPYVPSNYRQDEY